MNLMPPIIRRTINLFHEWRRDWGGVIVLTALLITLALWGWLIAFGGTGAHVSDILYGAYLAVQLAGVVLAARVVAQRAQCRPTRVAWALFALAQLAYFLGNGQSVYAALVIGGRAFPSSADAAFLLFYPLLLAGILRLPAPRRARSAQLTFWLDTSMVLLGGGMLIWYLLFRPLAHDQRWLEQALLLAYPVGDLVLLFAIMALLFKHLDRRSQPAISLLALGLLLNFAADLGYAFLSLRATYVNGTWANGLFLLAFCAIAVSAQCQYWMVAHPDSGAALRAGRARWFYLLPYLSLVIGYGVLISLLYEQWRAPVGSLMLGAMALTGCAIARLFARVHEAEARFRTALESSLDACFFLQSLRNAQGQIEDFVFVDSNRNGERLLGLSRSAISGQRLCDLLPINRTEGFIARYIAVVEHRTVLEEEFSLADGNGGLVWRQHQVVPLNDGIAITTRDITARKQADLAQRESEALYRLISERVGDLIAIFDGKFRFLYASPSHRQVLGRDPADLIGVRGTDLMHPDDAAAITGTAEVLRANGTARQTFRYRHSDGSWRWLESSATHAYWQGVGCAISVARDITAQKNLESQLLHAQKMESVGRLAGGLAHDFNNMMTAIIGFAELGLLTLPADDPLAADLGEIHKAAESAARLTRQLLTFARKQVIEPRVLSLNDLIRDSERLLHRLAGPDVELVTVLAPDLGLLRVDFGQFEQLLVNLVVNARDAMPSGGTLTIETQNVVLDDDYAKHHLSVAPGAYVMLAVSDTGVGMPPDVQAHIFEPFFTTKEAGMGVGLGLATCYGIVQQHGGSIWVYSEVAQGTTFKIYIPRVAALMLLDQDTEDDVLPSGSETVLVVEDDPAVRQLTGRVLRARGYTVLEATQSAEALDSARAYPGTIHLLLTDVVLPKVHGRALAEQMLPLAPTIKVLFMSGYTSNAIGTQGQIAAGVHFLQKPFTPTALAHKVRAVLDA